MAEVVPPEPGPDPSAAVDALDEMSPRRIKLFGSPAFFRLWMAQVVLSIGDWLGFVAITALAANIGGSSPEASIGLVLSARLVPGFFLAPVAGVLIDRWDRKRVMVACSVGRGVVLCFLPFVDTIVGLFVASLLLEVLTLMWAPAKEASVPKLVRPEFLPTANSLSLIAAYGTFPLGSALFALLAKVAEWLGSYETLDSLRVSQGTVAIWVYVVCCFVSAVMISTLHLPHTKRVSVHAGLPGLSRTFQELAEGWRFIGEQPVVRAVILGLGTGLIGGGMLVPLGPVMSQEVFGGGAAGFGLLLTAMGSGVAGGIILLSVVQRRLPHERMFVGCVLGAGLCIMAGASMSTLEPALVFVALLGLCAGAVYVLGFTILQSRVEDELRGRVFATLYTLIRLCLLLAFAAAPAMAALFGSLANRWAGADGVVLLGIRVALPGARLALWVGGLVILVAGALSARILRAGRPAGP